MNDHPFIFQPGIWLGEGTISFDMVSEKLKYYLRWSFFEDEGSFSSLQEIEIQGGIETVKNKFHYYDVDNDRFKLSLENEIVGRTEGSGVYDDNYIAWEFRNKSTAIDGYESYRLKDDGTYEMKAEYASPDRVRTMIKGIIWRRHEG